jgi:ferredoxin
MNKIIINNKICDQSPACGGIEVCPTNALFYDEGLGQIGFAQEKCIGCGACVNMCPIKAIHLARSAAEEQKIQAEIDTDPHKEEELFQDRYGAEGQMIQATENAADTIEVTRGIGGYTAVELFDEETLHCLATSIPYSDIFSGHGVNIKVFRAQTDKNIENEFGITEIPALLFFKDGELIGKIEGFFFDDNPTEKALLISKVKKILG